MPVETILEDEWFCIRPVRAATVRLFGIEQAFILAEIRYLYYLFLIGNVSGRDEPMCLDMRYLTHFIPVDETTIKTAIQTFVQSGILVHHPDLGEDWYALDHKRFDALCNEEYQRVRLADAVEVRRAVKLTNMEAGLAMDREQAYYASVQNSVREKSKRNKK